MNGVGTVIEIHRIEFGRDPTPVELDDYDVLYRAVRASAQRHN